MNLTPYISSIEDSLAAAAAAGDDGTRRAASALTAALEPAVRLGIMSALAEFAVEVTDALGDRVAEVRLEGGDVRIVVSRTPDVEEDTDADDVSQLTGTAGESSRVTLRLPEELKTGAERAATTQGVSLNTWLSWVVRDALRAGGAVKKQGSGRDERTHRVRGWIQG